MNGQTSARVLAGLAVLAVAVVAFIVASEILLSTVRAVRDLASAEGAAGTVAAVIPTAPASVPQTVAYTVPADVLEGVPEIEPASTVPTAPATVPRTVTSGRTRRARVASAKTQEKMFAAEIERGELPSVRAIKTQARCGTPRAQVIRDDLARLIREAQPAAALPQP